MKGKPKLHILYDYQLNIYLTVDSAFSFSFRPPSCSSISIIVLVFVLYILGVLGQGPRSY